MYHHLLVAIDLVDSDLAVLEMAAKQAEWHRCELSVVHCCEGHVTGYGESTSKHHIANEMAIKQSVYPHFKKMTDSVFCDRTEDESYHCQILFGRPADTIHLYAQQHHCDLIIIGSHGYSGVKAMLGSTAHKVMQDALCDVYAVHIKD